MANVTRKKQAVTKTHNAKTIALIRKNGDNSPLLHLPSEVREKILINLVGGKLIHVKYLIWGELISARMAEGKESDDIGDDWLNQPWSYRRISDKRIQGAFRHTICVAEDSEHRVYEDMIEVHEILPDNDSSGWVVDSCDQRHSKCHFHRKDDSLNSSTVDLDVLGVCRQLYEEANHLLWTTNIFSFNDPLSFDRFFGSLNPAQKRKITSLHLNIKPGHVGDPYSLNTMEQWGIGLRMLYLNMLRGIKDLHLCLEQRPDFSLPSRDEENYYEWAKTNLTEDLEPILRLRALRAKNVTVTVNDKPDDFNTPYKLPFQWTANEMIDYAQDIRTRLLDPNGRESLKAEIEIKKRQNKLDYAKSAWRRALCAERLANESELLAKRMSDSVKTCEAEVDMARKDAMRVTGKKSRASDEVQAHYKQLQLNASRMRQQASDAVKSAEENRADSIMKATRYQRAEARAGDHAALAKLNAEAELDTEDDDSSFMDESSDEDIEELEAMSMIDSEDEDGNSDVEMGDVGDSNDLSELSDDA